MTLHHTRDFTIPTQTGQIAKSAYADGNLYLSMRDELGTIFTGEQLRDLYLLRGQLAEAPWRLALVTLMQFAENLTDC